MYGIQVVSAKRKEYIRKELLAQAENIQVKLNAQGNAQPNVQPNLQPRIDESLLDEVNFLVEKPKVLVGQLSKEFLALPDIVITTEMQEHQRYFPLEKQMENQKESSKR